MARGQAKGDEPGHENRGGGSGRKPEAAPDCRMHPIVDAGVRAGTLRGGDRRDDVTASGEHDRLVEDDVPDNDRPRELQQRCDPPARSVEMRLQHVLEGDALIIE